MSVLSVVLIGIGATVVIDLWALFLKHAFKVPSFSFCMIGRWFLHMPKGKFIHSRIAAAEEQPSECAVGWTAHYVIGVVFALMFIGFVSDSWLEHPTLVPALIFGAGTVLFPYFLLQPALGLGIAASKAANPTHARLKSLITHAMFGVGLYLSAMVVATLA